jgi:hypothetical protein
MTSLLDIGPLTEEVEIRGKNLTVQGLTAGHLFQLFADFPEIRKLIDGKHSSPQEMLLMMAPDLIGKIIAMSLGEHGNKAVEDKAKQLGADDQLIFLTAIQRLSFKDGIAPFVDRITALLQPLTTTTVPMMGLKGGSGDSTTRSPSASLASLQMDTPEMMRGPARRAN